MHIGHWAGSTKLKFFYNLSNVPEIDKSGLADADLDLKTAEI